MGVLLLHMLLPTFGIKLALRGGVDTIEHGTDLDDECISLFLKRVQHWSLLWLWPISKWSTVMISICPLSTLEFSRRRWDRQIAMLRKAFDAGVTIATGTDSIIDGMMYYDEVELLVDAVDISPMHALVAATRSGAHSLGSQGRKWGRWRKASSQTLHFWRVILS
ncbi:MAG: amidohydrolase family protein [Chloroflexi bacterium]|nr:amidohydrolase family protein [Chloroflexota bacterium]